jgi:hypothetical protein
MEKKRCEKWSICKTEKPIRLNRLFFGDPGKTIPEPVLSRFKDPLRIKNNDNQIDIRFFCVSD